MAHLVRFSGGFPKGAEEAIGDALEEVRTVGGETPCDDKGFVPDRHWYGAQAPHPSMATNAREPSLFEACIKH
jgi:hypothetical protein